jgi:type II secretory ATPase GspE/PulE/Tfp pilus assembly ATPase PilB-like protein
MFMNGCSEKELTRQALAEGMKTLLDDAIAKAVDGLTSIDEILRVL